MANVSIYNADGKVTGDLTLSDAHFGVKVDAHLVHDVVRAQQANARRVTGHAKTRGEVSGGGKKPWKQKGTGRARQGSIRAPQWVGGGVAHGPLKDRNYSLKVNRKVKQKALFMALSDKVKDSKLVVLESLPTSEAKTKVAATVLKRLPLGRRTLFVVPQSNPTLLRMVRNIPTVKLVTVNTVNILDVVNHATVLFEKDAVSAFEKHYGNA